MLSKAVTPGHAPVSGQRELHFVFFHKPDRFLESDGRSGHLGGIRLEKTTLKGNNAPQKSASEFVVWNLYSLVSLIVDF